MIQANSISDIKAQPFFSKFTTEQIRNQIRKNLEGIRQMHMKAVNTGKKQGGFTVDQLKEMCDRYEKILNS